MIIMKIIRDNNNIQTRIIQRNPYLHTFIVSWNPLLITNYYLQCSQFIINESFARINHIDQSFLRLIPTDTGSHIFLNNFIVDVEKKHI